MNKQFIVAWLNAVPCLRLMPSQRHHSSSAKWMAIVLALTLSASNVSAARSVDGCLAPVVWRIGKIDSGFDISRAKLHRLANKAAMRWNRVLGRSLFKHRSRAKFTVNLRYGIGQEAAEAIQDINSHAEERTEMLDEMMIVLQQLIAKYEQDSARFDALGRQFSIDTGRFQQRADRRERSDKEHRRLLKDQKVLKQQQAVLVREQKRLQRARDEIEALRSKVNLRVERHNNTVSKTNRTLQELPKEAHKLGVTHINGPRSKIDLLQYYDDETLYLTLLHEFGHALGLQHLSDIAAVMHAKRNQSTAKDLTKNDIRALRKLC